MQGKTASTTKAVFQLCPVNSMQYNYKTVHKTSEIQHAKNYYTEQNEDLNCLTEVALYGSTDKRFHVNVP